MKTYVCTHSDSEMIYVCGESTNIEEAKKIFFDSIECDYDYEDGDAIEWSVFEAVDLKDFLCNNIRGVYTDGILEDLFEDCAFEDIWPTNAQSERLETLIISTVKNWVRNNPEFNNKWQCGDLIENGVYIKGIK